jgi:hypothetical protein
MNRTARTQGFNQDVSDKRRSAGYVPFEHEANEIAAESRSRLRRHEMLELSDLFLDYDDEIRQERGQDW